MHLLRYCFEVQFCVTLIYFIFIFILLYILLSYFSTIFQRYMRALKKNCTSLNLSDGDSYLLLYRFRFIHEIITYMCCQFRKLYFQSVSFLGMMKQPCDRYMTKILLTSFNFLNKWKRYIRTANVGIQGISPKVTVCSSVQHTLYSLTLFLLILGWPKFNLFKNRILALICRPLHKNNSIEIHYMLIGN